jgi:putative ABC transport system permease protein
MMRLVLRGLAGRRTRTTLTALAIVLGVAMVSGTYVFTDRMERAVDTLFTGAYTGADAVISGKDVVQSAVGRDATVPDALVARVSTLSDVDATSGAILDTARLLDKHGKPISTQNSAVGLSIDPRPSARRFNPLRLTAGRWPAGPRQTAIDAETAERQGFEIGDTIAIATRAPVRRFTIAGIAVFSRLNSIGSLTLAIFDLRTAQALFGKAGRLDEILVAAKPGVSPRALVPKLQRLVPARAQVVTGHARVKAQSKGTDKQLALIRKFLLAFGGIALFVGAFVIFNTQSITIAQRTRELATLRTLGASRSQVLASVTVESLVMGGVASIAGLLIGVGLANGLAALFVAAGIDLPDSGSVLATRTIVVSLLAGVLITVVAGLVPALRATRVPPVAAVREGATLPVSSLARRTPHIAAAAIALGASLLSVGLFAGGLDATKILALLALGCLVLFVGVAMIASALVRPLAAALGWPARRLAGAAGRLARENSTRNPNRTAATAAALMIYLALVTFVAVLGHGMRTSITAGVDRAVRAHYVITADDGESPLPPAVGGALADRPKAATVSSVRQDTASAFGADKAVNGLDPQTIADVVRFDWDAGAATDLTKLGANGAVLQHDFAADHDLRVGGRFGIQTAQGRKLELTVKGIYSPPGLDPILGPIGIARRTFDAAFERPQDAFTFLTASGGTTDANTTALTAALRAFPEAQLQTTAAFGDGRTKDIRTTLNVVYALLALSVIVSLLGMVNTLVLSVFERTRELGMLRAVGMTRPQVRRMIRHESVITALIGAALGLPLGLLLAALATEALSDIGVAFAIPAPTLALLALTALLAGFLAAIFPARRAARLNVLEALHYE